MDEVGTATLSSEGGEQVVRLPEGFRLPGRELRVTRVGDGLLLRPVDFDVDAWWAKLDAYQDTPFMEEGRQQPPMPDDDTCFDR
ncbi:antitoxin [Lichenibacterium dinghuense]|uniref:antitoxin n=1 Tax=Lichenibacterium dinghuense TaxID=2895977 RepID=UPI001F36EEF1|nr:AbrB/MazE/SpoVT family DNA-binding domain-containing protein [Lichenibacterium sp. 6Y81]